MYPLADKNVQNLISALLSGNHLAEVVDSAALLLRNPLALFDTSYHLLAHSASLQSDDSTWNETIKRGYWSHEFVANLHRRMESAKYGRQAASIIGGISPLRRRIAALCLDGVQLGYFVVIEDKSSFEDTAEEIYALTASVLAKEMSAERLSAPYIQGQTCETILSDLLHSNFPNRMLLRERIAGTDFERLSRFGLIVMDLQHYTALGFLDETLKATISRFFTACWSVFIERFVVVLVDLEHTGTKLPAGLESFLRTNAIRAAKTGEFTDLFSLPGYYAQATRTLDLAAMVHETRPLVLCDKYKLVQLISGIPRKQLEFYCTDVVMKIREYDRHNHTDYLKTLFHYLHTGRSVQQTAQHLFIHRNTVTYRIDRIKELFHIDFQNTYDNTQNYLSCLAIYYYYQGAI